jgi:ketosteroid isomerase-like protein
LRGEQARTAAADEEAVRTLVVEFDRCAREKDLEKFLSHSVEDVIALAPGEPAVVGKKALRTWYKGFYAAFDVAMVHRPIETTSFGGVVIARGNAVGTIRSVSGGEPIPVDNKYLFVLKRQADGSLKVWRAMFNANGPATPGGK